MAASEGIAVAVEESTVVFEEVLEGASPTHILTAWREVDRALALSPSCSLWARDLAVLWVACRDAYQRAFRARVVHTR